MGVLQFIMDIFGQLFNSLTRLDLIGLGTLRGWFIFIGIISISTTVVWKVFGITFKKEKVDKTSWRNKRANSSKKED